MQQFPQEWDLDEVGYGIVTAVRVRFGMRLDTG
jgi:hypothetical protein